MSDQDFYQKTVLVTGATGLIGEHLCRALLKKGANVIALSRSEKKLQICFGDILDDCNFKYVAQDVSTPPMSEDIIDIIFHAAGPIAGDIIRNRPMEIIAPNIFGTNNLLTLLKKQKETRGVSGRMVLCSSATVYSNKTEQDILAREEDTCVTNGLQASNIAYAESKRMMEVMANAYYRQYGVDTVCARLSYVYGPATFKADTAFYEFIEKASRGEAVIINDPCMEKRDWIYVDDAVDGLLLLALQDSDQRVFNVSSGGEKNSFIAADEIAAIAADLYNRRHPSIEPPARVQYRADASGRRRPGIILDNTKIKQLGLNIRTDIQTGIKKTMFENSVYPM